ncbi:MAG: VCBS repeat-containing protein [Planctomycetes bacterium]|nr:VCBS repeat-containing protein [Planctomycetota bacterium]
MKSLRSLALIPLAVAAACARHSGEIAQLGLSDIPLFETRIDITTGTFDHADFRVADFDGDGQLDMAVLSVTGALRILLGDGTSFATGQSLQVQGRPWWIRGADLDGDQDEDLVVLSSEPGTAQVWLNNGTGTFEQGQALETDVDALSLEIGDFDGDGIDDLAISRPNAATVIVAFGNGNGTFGNQLSLTLPGGGRAFTVLAGDATRDGVDDLIVSDPDTGRIVVYDGLPQGYFGGSFCELRVGFGPSACSLGDLSGDGAADLVVSALEGKRYVVITDILGPVGKGQFFDGALPGGIELPFLRECDYLSFEIPVSGRAGLSAVADVTGDGLPDLIGCLQFENQVVVAPQVVGGDYSEQFQFDSLGRATRPFVTDVDGNGKNDLLVLSALADRINLWLARDSGRLAGGRNYSSGIAGSNWIESADFDGDGSGEIAAGSVEDTKVSFLGRGNDDSLVVEAVVEIGASVRQLKSADLDGDGRVDLVVGIEGGVRILRNLSTGGSYDFEQVVAPLTIGSTAFPFGIAVADLDRDGDFDLAVCDVVGGGLHLLPGTPTPFVFDAATVIDLGGGPIDVAAADFTGDGLQDLAVSRFYQSDIRVLRNDGGFAFSSLLAVPLGLNDNPNYLVTADFNRDGRSDLVVSRAAPGTISVLFGSDNGFSGQAYEAGFNPTALMAQDLSGDGVPDILVTSMVGGDFRVMVGDGVGGFPTLLTYPGTSGASDALLQDMTGDGVADLLIGSIVGNRISLVRNITEN